MMRQSYILDWALWVRMVINASCVEAGTQNVNCQDSPNAVIGLKISHMEATSRVNEEVFRWATTIPAIFL